MIKVINTYVKACAEILKNEAQVITNRKKELKNIYQNLNSNLKLPDRKELAGSVLDNAINDINQLCENKLYQVHEQAGITLAFDGRINIINQHLLGSVIILPSGESLV
ncbi:hypothetical protein F8M41_014792 [Gigaspora margarita]|uniref:Uncharacterized protein n=1 Tax=Gigaspora margarita TaxID=4874 RepID=A0A8H4ENU5_GIGMA|nr:hypothetical protein F8M41_014792 [Gigaspora margarita]